MSAGTQSETEAGAGLQVQLASGSEARPISSSALNSNSELEAGSLEQSVSPSPSGTVFSESGLATSPLSCVTDTNPSATAASVSSDSGVLPKSTLNSNSCSPSVSSTALAIANFRPTSKEVISGIAPHVFDERRTRSRRSRSRNGRRRSAGMAGVGAVYTAGDGLELSRRRSRSLEGIGSGFGSIPRSTFRTNSATSVSYSKWGASPLRLSAVVTVEDIDRLLQLERDPDQGQDQEQKDSLGKEDSHSVILPTLGDISITRKRSRKRRSGLEFVGIGRRKSKSKSKANNATAGSGSSSSSESSSSSSSGEDLGSKTPKRTKWSLVLDVQARVFQFRYV
ncbi:hypothetical protein BT96DRAFT_1006154 [Gymnopus androsaceus JB14]|uniref:Uncharacterized protein n=1 Tax=Gymnopus androsaceus JB14 TaxID=1447944 RepID=A0A6A4GME5_9AGAR|nr:hypothetical protein BT96DRAFT_1006154 [Gymnopus androsaceus JB14]